MECSLQACGDPLWSSSLYSKRGVQKPISLIKKLRLREVFNLPKGRVAIKLNTIYSRACVFFSISCSLPCLKNPSLENELISMLCTTKPQCLQHASTGLTLLCCHWFNNYEGLFPGACRSGHVEKETYCSQRSRNLESDDKIGLLQPCNPCENLTRWV